MKYRYIFFDLDGTLVESGPGIRASLIYALEKYGITDTPEETFRRVIGPPLSWTFRELFHLPEEKIPEAIAYYREFYRREGMFIGRLYDGIPELLKKLKEEGCYLALATAKPLDMSERILKYFGIWDYFSAAEGGNDGPKGGDKARIISTIMEREDIIEREQCLMVGDRYYDIAGAKELGIASAGSLYGYGTLDELLEAGADCIIRTPEELLTAF